MDDPRLRRYQLGVTSCVFVHYARYLRSGVVDLGRCIFQTNFGESTVSHDVSSLERPILTYPQSEFGTAGSALSSLSVPSSGLLGRHRGGRQTDLPRSTRPDEA